MNKKKITSGIFIGILLLVSISSSIWYIDKYNVKPRIIDVYGDSYYEMGLMYGSQVKNIVSGIGEVANYLEKGLPLLNGSTLEEIAQGYLAYTPNWAIQMMWGIANSTGVDFYDIVILNAFADLAQLLMLMVYMGCSQFAMINNTYHGLGPIFGRTLDYPAHNIFDNWQIIVRYDPPNGNSMIGVTIAGWVGFLSGMNNKGVSMGISQISSEEVEYGCPMGIIITDGLMNYNNTRDIQQYLTNGSISSIYHAGAWCYFITDKTGDACIVEITSYNNHTNWHSDVSTDHLVITNHFVSSEMIPHSFVPGPQESTLYRKQVLEEYLLIKDNFDLKDAVETVRSHYDITINGDPGQGYENCICNDGSSGTMHAFIAVVAHNYSLICLTNPYRAPFYLVSFTEVIGPVA
ncbi:MAG: hypothetical protein GF329_09460 [Candidatus Lokiarchaeota archaeon]|nr:hypothetical protein [Candidatus Lokiarchaeota archaeon]